MHGKAQKTSGGLTKKQLKYNKQGKIVSRKASALATKNNRLVKAGYVTKKGKFGSVVRGGGRFYFIKIKKDDGEFKQKVMEIDVDHKKIKIWNEIKDNESEYSIENIEIKNIKNKSLTIKSNGHQYDIRHFTHADPNNNKNTAEFSKIKKELYKLPIYVDI